MMEGEAKEVPEEIIVDAIKFGLESIRPVIDLQDQIQAAIGKAKRPVEETVPDEELVARVREEALPGLRKVMPCRASWNDTVNWAMSVRLL